jgi:CBS domain-containing protein
MWETDCGILPVIDHDGVLVGVITDRDLCIALCTRGVNEVKVRDVMTREVHTCRPERSVRNALKIMADKQVRRLPVVDSQGRLEGIISLRDAALHSGRIDDVRKRGIISYLDLAGTLKAISQPRTEGAHS